VNPGRVAAIARREWREVSRDRLLLLLAFLLPVLLMFVLGYGLAQDVERVPLAIVDEDGTAASREYVAPYFASRDFHVIGYVDRVETAEHLLVAGRARVVLVIPAGFDRDVGRGRPAHVQALVDGTFVTSARIVTGYLDAIAAGAEAARANAAVAVRLGVSPARADVLARPVRVETRYLYNQDLRTIWAIAPSLVMTILLWTSPLLVGLSLVREKERGSLIAFAASETTRLEFLLGKLLPSAGIATVNALALWGLAVWYFGAPFRGSAGTFIAAAAAFVLAGTSYGLLVSLWVRTQQAALMIVMLSGAIVGIHFSGMFEAVPSLPPINRAIAHLTPAMYFNRVLLGTFLKGAGWTASWRDIAVTGAFAGGAFALAYLSFHKRVRA